MLPAPKLISNDLDPPRPLTPVMRKLLLRFLDLAYPAPANASPAEQRGLRDAPDAAIAWQAQSALDDYACYAARRVWADERNAAVDARIEAAIGEMRAIARQVRPR